ncbi:hypothetical protein H696_01740 [Fonticula alba]|uniref:Large ribosomal subunit protein uL4m n=1 Tax=Fonticula alba TaxID=691883 RepID=A0A058ZFU8_FONAL|nr:hypothetical protein H696_01740 [Fonticula alba]KCV72347.1 hypothetical protein H696_01740 [Fonticula alba]|eukprot:XP_009493925.1 hypothetical protein H696_01740 [Fonticula alba]
MFRQALLSSAARCLRVAAPAAAAARPIAFAPVTARVATMSISAPPPAIAAPGHQVYRSFATVASETTTDAKVSVAAAMSEMNKDLEEYNQEESLSGNKFSAHSDDEDVDSDEEEEQASYAQDSTLGSIRLELFADEDIPFADTALHAWVEDFQTGQSVAMAPLHPEVFGAPIRADLLQRVVRWQLAKRRAGTASTKTRSEVAGATRKLYAQKGSGRARVNGITSPIRRGGGITHGPRPRNFEFSLQKKVRCLALRTAMTVKFAQDKLTLVQPFDIPSHKTRCLYEMLFARGLENKRVLFVFSGPTPENFSLAYKNLPGVNVLPAHALNVFDLLRHDHVFMTTDSALRLMIRFIHRKYLTKKSAQPIYADPALSPEVNFAIQNPELFELDEDGHILHEAPATPAGVASPQV